MNLDAAVEVLNQTVQTLFHAGPTGRLAIAVMALLFVIACLGLVRIRRQLQHEEAALDSIADSPRSRSIADAPQASDDESSEESTRSPSRIHVDDIVDDGPIESSHAYQVFHLVVRHSRLTNPDAAVVAEFARGISPAGLDRQKATQNVILLVGLAGTVLGLAAAIGEVRLGISSGAASASFPELSTNV